MNTQHSNTTNVSVTPTSPYNTHTYDSIKPSALEREESFEVDIQAFSPPHRADSDYEVEVEEEEQQSPEQKHILCVSLHDATKRTLFEDNYYSHELRMKLAREAQFRTVRTPYFSAIIHTCPESMDTIELIIMINHINKEVLLNEKLLIYDLSKAVADQPCSLSLSSSASSCEVPLITDEEINCDDEDELPFTPEDSQPESTNLAIVRSPFQSPLKRKRNEERDNEAPHSVSSHNREHKKSKQSM
jgi:hypothetical protein